LFGAAKVENSPYSVKVSSVGQRSGRLCHP
jgi:hypothetical protein